MADSNSAGVATDVAVVSNSQIIRAMRKQPSMVYCLQSQAVAKSTATYIGFTVNPYRRLRQHNGEVSSGARRTSKRQPWRFVAIVCGFPAHVIGLQFEWACTWRALHFFLSSRMQLLCVPQGNIPSAAHSSKATRPVSHDLSVEWLTACASCISSCPVPHGAEWRCRSCCGQRLKQRYVSCAAWSPHSGAATARKPPHGHKHLRSVHARATPPPHHQPFVFCSQAFAAMGALPAGSSVQLATPPLLRALSGREATPAELKAWEAAFTRTSVEGLSQKRAPGTQGPPSPPQAGRRMSSLLFSDDGSEDSKENSNTTPSQSLDTPRIVQDGDSGSCAGSLDSADTESLGSVSGAPWLLGTQIECSVCSCPPSLLPLWFCPGCSSSMHLACVAAQSAQAESRSSSSSGGGSGRVGPTPGAADTGYTRDQRRLSLLLPGVAHCPTPACTFTCPWSQIAAQVRGALAPAETAAPAKASACS